MNPLIIAHRGASLELPENTLEAFELALTKYHADMIEFDVRFSRDSVPVIIHDSALERTTDGAGRICHYTAKELKNYDAGYFFSPPSANGFPCRNRGFRIPTLEELLKKFPDQRLMVEIKDPSPKLAHRVADLLRQYRHTDKAVITSEHHVIYRTLTKHDPDIAKAFSHPALAFLYLFHRLNIQRPSLKALPLYASMPLNLWGMALDSELWIDYLHEHKVGTIFWTINDPQTMKALRDKGADALVTDDPGLMREILKHI